MATKTKSELAELVLTLLGVKAQGQSISADDDALVTSIIDSVIDELQPKGCICFDTSAVPEWAQMPLAKMIVYEAAPAFGRPQNYQAYKEGRSALISGADGTKNLIPARAKYY